MHACHGMRSGRLENWTTTDDITISLGTCVSEARNPVTEPVNERDPGKGLSKRRSSVTNCFSDSGR